MLSDRVRQLEQELDDLENKNRQLAASIDNLEELNQIEVEAKAILETEVIRGEGMKETIQMIGFTKQNLIFFSVHEGKKSF